MTIAVIIAFAIQGLIVGALARLALPGKDPMSIWQTMGVGMLSSFLAGLAVYALTDGQEAPGFLGAFIVAFAIVYFIRRRRGGGLTDPGTSRTRRELR